MIPLTTSALLVTCRARAEHQLAGILRQGEMPSELRRAMQYSVLNGGKRMRPLLCYAGALAAGGDLEAADIPAAAVECIHAYSLIHDDLPAMDDDALRRGLPTCHVVFGQAMAILAGDALQTLAFELLVQAPRLAVGHGTRLAMLRELTRASGAQGMVGGQVIDIQATGLRLTEAELGHMHALKTGALIRASVLLGAMSTNLATAAQLRILGEFATLAGLAFQIQDDILDGESSSRISGKQQGKDAIANKPTYLSILGLQEARQRLQQTAALARACLQPLGPQSAMLAHLLDIIVPRDA